MGTPVEDDPDPTKPAEEILFSQKKRTVVHPPLFFNGVEVKRVSEHKHLGLISDPLLNFASLLKEKSAKDRNGIQYRLSVAVHCLTPA